MKVREKRLQKRLPPVGSVAWVECLLGRVEEGLGAAEHDVRLLCESVQALQNCHCWELLFPDEPRNWARVVRERVDPVHGRVEWLQAVCDGYRQLRGAGHAGRISRRDAEHAAGRRLGDWCRLDNLLDERSRRLVAWRGDSVVVSAASSAMPAVAPAPVLLEPVVPPTAAPELAIAAPTPSETTSLCVVEAIRAPDSAAATADRPTSVVDVVEPAALAANTLAALKQVWETAAAWEKELFASWIAAPVTVSAGAIEEPA